MDVHYHTDNLNKVFFASTGNKLQVALSRSIRQDVDINYANNSAQNYSGSLNPFTKFNFSYKNRIPIKNKVLIMEASAGLLFEDKNNLIKFLPLSLGMRLNTSLEATHQIL